ncbi:MAG: restriction endonuclease subunit S [Elusimicrobia bacterium]|nr:restriction endonuclease subunit S [Elusimicrobiota bacterium]
MAGKWIECKLADACASIDYGLTASAADHQDGPKFLRITDIVSGHIDWKTVPHVTVDDEAIPKYQLRDGDIVVARTGASTGASAYIRKPPKAVFASYLVRLQARPEFDPRFLAYYMRSDQFWSFIGGVLGDKSAQPNASASTMTQAPLRAPRDRDEQCAIAHILGTLDDKIELNRRMNETLEAMAQAIFKSWFVETEAAGEWGKIEDVATISREAINPGEFPEETFDHYSVPAFDEGRLPKPEAGGQIKSNKFVVPPEAVLLCKLNPRIPRVWIPTVNGERRSVCSTEFLVAVHKAGVSREYLFGLFNAGSFLEVFASLVTGTSGSHQRVKPEYLLAMEVLIPPKKQMEGYTKLVRPHLERIALNLSESRILAAIRDALLPKLLSGEIRVRIA